MGTHFNQNVRNNLDIDKSDIQSFIDGCQKIAEDNNISISTVVESVKVLEFSSLEAVGIMVKEGLDNLSSSIRSK
jgi:hypothetical protein